MIFYTQNGSTLLEVEVDDSSYRYREIMGDNTITLYFSLAEHVEIPLGAYVYYQGERYSLQRPEALKMNHTRNFEYTVTLESEQAKAKIWKFRCVYSGEQAALTDGRLKFSLTAKPIEHLQMFIDNMNRRDCGWTIGSCIDDVEKCISYDHAYCWAALGQMADEFDTEFEIIGKQVSLHKVEYNKTAPLPLSYGKGNGFKTGVERSNYEDTPPIEFLFAQGGTDNIDSSKYGASELHLPKNGTIAYDGTYFEDEAGFDESNARQYVADDKGYAVSRLDGTHSSYAEDSLDCSSIYPQRVGTIDEVVAVDADNNFYDFIDNTIPDSLDYNDYLIGEDNMTVIFQSGMLAGKEFDVKYIHKATSKKKGKRFEIVPQEIDGQTMPNETFKPEKNDTYAVFNCYLPDAYINAYTKEGDKKEGAEWDMMRKAVKYLYDNETENFSFTGTLDGIYAKKNWANIGDKLRLGGFILFTDDRFQKEGVRIRIINIKDYINTPYSPEVELSNSTVSGSFSSTLQELKSSEVYAEEQTRDAIQFTKRRFRDAKETLSMLEEAMLDNFTNSIQPITVQTMAMLVGDESLQFRFVDSATSPQQVDCIITYDQTAKTLHCPSGIIQHMTMGISALSPGHEASEYRFWTMEEYTSGRLDDGDVKYYLYAKVTRAATGTGTYYLSTKAIKMDSDDDTQNYYLLIGILNSEYDGERSFATLYGYSEILPGRITTDKVVSSGGNSYFDLVNNAMKLGDALQFNTDGNGQLKLRGTLVQSQSGVESPLGCYRGEYDSEYTYYNGDEVSYEYNGVTSTYRYIYDTASSGHTPTETTYWQVIAAGVKGADGTSIAIKGTAYYHFTTVAEAQAAVTETGKECLVDQTYESATSTESKPGVARLLKNGFWRIAQCSAGDGYVMADTGNLWVASDSDWQDCGQIRGDKGDKGDTGATGNYTELRYAVNGSMTTPPTISKTDLSPSGWSTEVPSVGSAQYLWQAQAVKTADGKTLVTQWSTPVRITPYDGKDGADGESPAMVYRGTYDASKTYYGNANRLDCVKSGDTYYIARIDAGEFDGIAPPDSTKWNAFGASFESVATQLLLADEANLAGWIYRNERMESQATDDYGNPMVYLDGKNGEMRLRGTIQHSTAVSGVYSDADLYSLPARTTASTGVISMGCEKEDIGKRCILTNMSEVGSMGSYNIRTSKFGWTDDLPKRIYYEPIGDYIIEPGATVEMTCFQLPSGTSIWGQKVSDGGFWAITNRFNKEIAPVVAMGFVTNTDDGATIYADSIAGTRFSVSRNGTGKYDGMYTITMPEFFDNINPPLIMLTGIGYSQGETSTPIKATLISQSGRTFVVSTSDDSSMNAGSFQFVVYSLRGWKH